MNFIPLKVALDEACMADFSRRYHFEEKDQNEIEKLYIKVAPRIHAQFHYVLLDDEDKVLGKDMSFTKEKVKKVGEDENGKNIWQKSGEFENIVSCYQIINEENVN